MSKGPRFFCDNCSAEVGHSAKSCPNCGRFFESVRCPSCNFVGDENTFAKGPLLGAFYFRGGLCFGLCDFVHAVAVILVLVAEERLNSPVLSFRQCCRLVLEENFPAHPK